MTVGRLGALAIAALLLALPARAGAQIFPPPGGGGDVDPGFTTPSKTLFAPPGQSLAYGVNPSRTGLARDPHVFGPTRLAWKRPLPVQANQPLYTHGKILVNAALPGNRYGSRVVALNPSNGHKIWQRSFDTTYFSAPIAATGDEVISVSYDGVVRAFTIKSGKLLWKKAATSRGDAAPIATGNAVYINRGGTVTALRASDGHLLWRSSSGLHTADETLALDNARVYVTDDCGSAAALSRTSGLTVWKHAVNTGSTCFGAPAMVSGGKVFAGGGWIYQALTGKVAGKLPISSPRATIGNTVVGFPNAGAYRVDNGKRIWGASTNGSISPTIGTGTVYYADDESVVGFDIQTGRRLNEVGTGLRTPSGVGGELPGITVAGKSLLLGSDRAVWAFRPLLRPTTPRSAFLLVSRPSVRAGKKIRVTIGLGAKLRHRGKRITLRARPFPGKHRYRSVGHRPARSDGTAVFHPRVKRNTVYAVRTKGAKRVGRYGVIAYPKYGIHARRVSNKRGIIGVKVKRVPGKVLAHRKAFAYIVRRHANKLVRLGGARLHKTGRSSARASVHFRLLHHVNKRDYLFTCVRGLSRAGWGPLDQFQRRCGTRVMRYHHKHRKHRRSAIAEAPSESASSAGTRVPFSVGATAPGAQAAG